MTSKSFLLVLLTSFTLICSFPPFPTGFLALGALVPFFLYLEGKNIKESFRVGYLVGLIWAAGTIFWIGHATIMGVIGAIIWVSFYFAFFSLLYAAFRKKFGQAAIWVTPFIWVSLELLAATGSMAFPWNSLAYTQTYYPVLIQYISVTGMYGISFWIILINVLIFQLIKHLKYKKKVIFIGSIIVVLILLPLIYGLSLHPERFKEKEKVKVALIQGNINPYQKWTPGFTNENFNIYRELTIKASKEDPDLIVWPETAAPCYLRYEKYYRNIVFTLANSLNIPLLTGTIDYKWTDSNTVKRYNSAFLFKPGTITIESYNKIQLVPFSERVPLVDTFPFIYNLAKILDLNVGNYFSGDSASVFTLQSSSSDYCIKFSTGICYDSVFPRLVQRFIQNGAQFVIIITNDGWFGNISGPYQHAQIAVLRAIENRVWIARCANTGISEFINPYGKIVKKTKLSERTVMTHSVYVNKSKSFFTKHGKYFVYLILCFDVFILIITFSEKNSYKGV
ncbi:MAG: apolipoprotein N-acyltransferase [bacterium]